MSHHPNHPHHDEHHDEHHEHEHHHAKRKGLHRDWRVWTVVILMLGGMMMYVLTVDESLGPDDEVQPAAQSPDVE